MDDDTPKGELLQRTMFLKATWAQQPFAADIGHLPCAGLQVIASLTSYCLSLIEVLGPLGAGQGRQSPELNSVLGVPGMQLTERLAIGGR